MSSEFKIMHEWERHQAMLDVEKKVLADTMEKLRTCITPSLKEIHKEEMKVSKRLIKNLKAIIKEQRKGSVQNKTVNRVERDLKNKLYLKQVYEETFEDLELQKVEKIEEDGTIILADG